MALKVSNYTHSYVCMYVTIHMYERISEYNNLGRSAAHALDMRSIKSKSIAVKGM